MRDVYYNQSYYSDVYAGFEDGQFARRWALGCAIPAGYSDFSWGSVLEFGAGLGQNLEVIQAARKWAVDISEESRVACERKGFKWSSDLKGVPDQAFDMLLARHSLEHVLDPLFVLRELLVKARTAANLFVVVPLDHEKRLTSLTDFDEHRHLFSWSPETIKNLLLEAGWKPVSVKLNNGRLLRRMTALLPQHQTAFSMLRGAINKYTPLKSAEIVVRANKG